MLLTCNDLAGLTGTIYYNISVNGLDSADIDDLCIDTVGSKHLCSAYCGINHDTGSYYGYVLTLSYDASLSDLELVIGLIVDNGAGCTAESDINRSLVLKRCSYGCLSLDVICGTHYHHSGNGSHKSDILVTLVGCTVLTYGDTRMGSTDLNVEMRISDGVSHLLECSSCCEHCEGAYEGDLTGKGKACCNAHHVGLCDTAVDMSVGISFSENTGLGSCCKVCIKYYELGKFFCQILKSISVALSGCYFLNVCHFYSFHAV